MQVCSGPSTFVLVARHTGLLHLTNTVLFATCICNYIIVDKPRVKGKCGDYAAATMTQGQVVVIHTDVGDSVRITVWNPSIMLHLHWDWKRILHLYMQSQHSLNWQQMLAFNCVYGRFTVFPDGQMTRFDPHHRLDL